MARLGDIATYINGYAFKPTDWSESGLPIIRIQDLTGNSYQANRYDGEYDPKYEVVEGDVLISWSASLGVYVWHGEKALLNQHIFKVVFDKVDVEKDFFIHQVKSVLEKAASAAHGATMKHLTKPVFDALPFYLPSKEEQKEIAAKLNQVEALIEYRESQLTQLDMLEKSRFVEMFGEPITNPMEWEKVNISAVVRGEVSNGFFAKRDDYCDNGNVKVLGVANVVNRMYSNIEALPQTNGTDADIQKYGVKYGDMLFCRSSLVAAGIGKASIVPKGVLNNVLFECHVIRLPLDLNKCVPEFMQVLSTTDYFRNQVISQAKTSTMTTIGQDGILRTEIILPPLELQKQFLSFIEQTDRLKLTIQASLDKLELLKKKLMQEFFG